MSEHPFFTYIFIILFTFIFLFNCGGGGGGGGTYTPPNQTQTFSPTLGFWSGDDISFTLKEGSLLVDSFSVTCKYSVQNSKCNGSGEITKTIDSSIEVIDNAFEHVTPPILDDQEFAIYGTFTSADTAEIVVSWPEYDSYCDATYDCGGTFYANYGALPDDTVPPPPPNPYEIYFSYLQYRNYPNPANNRYASFVGIKKNSEPVQETDVVSFQIKDSTGNVVTPTDSGFYRSPPYYFYNCSTSPCTEQSDVIDSGFYANFNNLAAGAYRITVETTDGQTITDDLTYPGQVVLPFVATATMESYYSNNNDLVLSWTNPTGSDNWDQVNQLRIILFGEDDAEVLYISANPSTQTVTIPASLISKVENLGHGILAYWQIQTRSYDSDNMNYARGYSF